ncbi:eukaryotic translation initiation factor 4E-1-like [Camellia sinensis]|uniref:eukaryotic translation initiation factor 4E-1-like n=1 Tax=Camellia sinensis TaxID=4442 RepID=UPI001035D084|nr:eukaryotic translation initiation factor 4E-1-like [Camellia sinensis]
MAMAVETMKSRFKPRDASGNCSWTISFLSEVYGATDTFTAVQNNDDGEEAGEGEIVSESKSGKAVVDEEQQHPLEHSWTFWFNNPSAKSKQATWGSSIRPIYTFSTVEQFWSLYNNVPHPSKLAVGASTIMYELHIIWRTK